MRYTLSLLFLVICGFRPDTKPARTQDNNEQTDFGVEETFQKPVPLLVGALQSLRMSKGPRELLSECAEEEGIQAAEIPASWFVASEIQLGKTPGSGLVVRGEDACLRGAHITQFWVLAKTTAGYRVVFQGRGDGMSVLPARTNGYRDLELIIVMQAGANVDNVRFRYSRGKYRASGHRIEHNQR